MKKQLLLILVVLSLLLCCSGCASSTDPDIGGLGGNNPNVSSDNPQSTTPPTSETQPKETDSVNTGLELTTYDGDYFALTMPKGWTLKTLGEYVDFSFIITNPNNPDMMIFRYGRLQPFLKSQQSKQLWQSLYGTGLFPDAPVMNDRTAGELLSLWGDCIDYQKKYGGSVFPAINNLNLLSNQSYTGVFSAYGGAESIAIASCTSASGKSCQCVLSTAVFDPGTNYNGGVDTSYLILYETVGIIVPEGTSSEDIQSMLNCAASVTFTEDYIKKSNAASDAQLASVKEQLSRNRVIMDSLQQEWLDYIQN